MNPVGLVLVFAGLFSAAGGFFDWEWFMNNYRARLFVKIFGRGGARVFYILLGLAIATIGVLMTMGVIQPDSNG